MKINNIWIPSLVDLGVVATGFYCGYNEGNLSETMEYATKYGPTAVTLFFTPLCMKLANSIFRSIYESEKKQFQDGSLEITLKDGTKKRYKDLNEIEKQEITPKLEKMFDSFKSSLSKKPKYLEATLKMGTLRGIETAIGYFAGKLCR